MDVPSLASSRSSLADTMASSSATPPTSKGFINGYPDSISLAQHSRTDSNITPPRPSRRRDSAILTINDPVAMHLLVETAIADAANFDILPYDDLEALKRDLHASTNRLAALRRKLALEKKLAEATCSLSRLPRGRTSGSTVVGGEGDSTRESGSTAASTTGTGNGKEGESAGGVEALAAANSAKSEELARKVGEEERNAFELRRRLLEHTAGVLQLTYDGHGMGRQKEGENGGREASTEGRGKGSGKRKGQRRNAQGDMTPESMELDFDEESFYKEPEQLDSMDADDGDGEGEGEGHGEHRKEEDAVLLRRTEERLKQLSQRMHEKLAEAGEGEQLPTPPAEADSGANTIDAHITYIERGLQSLPKPPQQSATTPTTPNPDLETLLLSTTTRLTTLLHPPSQSPSLATPEPTPATATTTLPPLLDTLTTRLTYLTDQKSILTRQIQQQRELNDKSDADRDQLLAELQDEIAMFEEELQGSKAEASNALERVAEKESEIMELMDTVRALEERRVRMEVEARESSGVDGDNNEALERARAEVETLKEGKEALQREFDAKVFESDTHREARLSLEEQITLKDEEIGRLGSALDEFVLQSIESQGAMDTLRREKKELGAEVEEKASALEACVGRLERLGPVIAERLRKGAKGEVGNDEEERELELRDLREGMEDAVRRLEAKEAELGMYVEKVGHLETALTTHEAALERAGALVQTAKQELDDLKREREAGGFPGAAPGDGDERFEALRVEKEELEARAARLDSELGLARAAVSNACGHLVRRRTTNRADRDSKALSAVPRAATTGDLLDVAQPRQQASGDGGEREGDPMAAATADLHSHIELMATELRETITAHEELVKVGIEFEREREHLEKMVDSLRDRCGRLEAQVSEARIEKLGLEEQQQQQGTTTATATASARKEKLSIALLKEEFKKVMREARREDLKILMAEVEERRRLEAMVRSFGEAAGGRVGEGGMSVAGSVAGDAPAMVEASRG